MDTKEIDRLSVALDAARAKWQEAYDAYQKVSALYDKAQTPEITAALQAADERLSAADAAMGRAGRALKAAKGK